MYYTFNLNSKFYTKNIKVKTKGAYYLVYRLLSDTKNDFTLQSRLLKNACTIYFEKYRFKRRVVFMPFFSSKMNNDEDKRRERWKHSNILIK